MAKHYNTQNDSASLSAFFLLCSERNLLINYCIFSTPLSPSCEEGVLNPLPSPRPFQKGKGCNRSSCRSEPLRFKVGGASEPSPGGYAGWDRRAVTGVLSSLMK